MKNWKTTGENPDYRFTLANERTFLAWVRTGLGFFVTAVAIDQLGVYMGFDSHFRWLSFAISGISVLCVVTGYIRWRRNEIAMRHNQALTYGVVGTVLMVATLMIILSAYFIL